jgi:hypothetical protein
VCTTCATGYRLRRDGQSKTCGECFLRMTCTAKQHESLLVKSLGELGFPGYSTLCLARISIDRVCTESSLDVMACEWTPNPGCLLLLLLLPDCAPGLGMKDGQTCTACTPGKFCVGADAANSWSNTESTCPSGLATTFQGAKSQAQVGCGL